jgi:AcrR family transcriptional regulator
MSSPGQGRRRYDVTSRRLQAGQTRDRILTVARRLFVEQGYAGTSIAQIAAEVGVSGRTVFGAFESKANLLKEVIDTALVGDTDQVPLARRPAMRRVHDATTADEAIGHLADAFAEVADRAYEVFAVLHGAAAVDPEIARLERDNDARRLTGAAQLAATLADRLGATDPPSVRHIRDTVWTLGSPLQYQLLVIDRGWTVQQYRNWIARALAAMLPPDPATGA